MTKRGRSLRPTLTSRGSVSVQPPWRYGLKKTIRGRVSRPLMSLFPTMVPCNPRVLHSPKPLVIICFQKVNWNCITRSRRPNSPEVRRYSILVRITTFVHEPTCSLSMRTSRKIGLVRTSSTRLMLQVCVNTRLRRPCNVSITSAVQPAVPKQHSTMEATFGVVLTNEQEQPRNGMYRGSLSMIHLDGCCSN